MVSLHDNEAAKPNPLLQVLTVLVGTWSTVGTHALVPGKTFHGRTTFSWIEGGAFLTMRSQIDEPEIPSGIAIIGTDDATGECSMLYFNERGVSRRYEMRLEGNEWRWWMAVKCFSYPRAQALFRRHLLAARKQIRPAQLLAGASECGRRLVDEDE